MIPIYLLTASMFILSLQKRVNLIIYILLFIMLSITYVYFSSELLIYFKNRESLSIYEKLFLQYFPFVLTVVISLVIKIEMQKKDKNILELENKLDALDNKIYRIIKLSSKVRKNKREIEKRLISEEKESIKIREIIHEISNFNISEIEKNILSYFSKLIPSSKLSFYKFENDKFNFIYSNYENIKNNQVLNKKVYSIINRSEKSVIPSFNNKEEIDKSILIPIKLSNEKLFALVTVDDIDFFELNRLTLNNLSYFKELLSLQIENSIIYKKQKETSFAYNDKNIYNFKFLLRLLEIDISRAKRHSSFSTLLIFKSDDFKNLNEKNSEIIFDKIEKMYKKLFRKDDLLFFNNLNNSFIILLSMTDENKHKYIDEKILNYKIGFDTKRTYIQIDANSEIKTILEKLGNI